MKTLKIEINSQNENFTNSLEEIKKSIENGNLRGFDKNEEGENYNFEITEKESFENKN